MVDGNGDVFEYTPFEQLFNVPVLVTLSLAHSLLEPHVFLSFFFEKPPC